MSEREAPKSLERMLILEIPGHLNEILERMATARGMTPDRLAELGLISLLKAQERKLQEQETTR